VAAVQKHVEAFHCLMKFTDLNYSRNNPVFKVLKVTVQQAEILEVRENLSEFRNAQVK